MSHNMDKEMEELDSIVKNGIGIVLCAAAIVGITWLVTLVVSAFQQ